MRGKIRWLMIGAASIALVAAAFGVAGATETSVGPQTERQHEHGAMVGDLDQIRDRDRIHLDAVTADAASVPDQDRDRLRLRDGSCQEDVTAASAQSGPVRERERTQARVRDAGTEGCGCATNQETNRNGGSDAPQQEQERNGSGPVAGSPDDTGVAGTGRDNGGS